MCHNIPRIGHKIHYNSSIQRKKTIMPKGLNIEVTDSQYQMLYDVLMEAYSNDVAEQ